MWRLGEPAVAIGLIVAAIELVGSQNSSVDWDLPAMNLAMARAAEAADLPDLMALGLARAKALTDGDYFADLATEIETHFAAIHRLQQTVSRAVAPSPLYEVARSSQWSLRKTGGPSRRIVRSRNGYWVVERSGATRASARFPTRAEAIERARQIVAREGGGELIVEHSDGAKEQVPVEPRVL